jgi:hypothetical protein
VKEEDMGGRTFFALHSHLARHVLYKNMFCFEACVFDSNQQQYISDGKECEVKNENVLFHLFKKPSSDFSYHKKMMHFFSNPSGILRIAKESAERAGVGHLIHFEV